MKNKKRNSAIILALLIFAAVACTLPIYFAQPPEAVEKIVYVEVTSTPESDDEANSGDDADADPTEPVSVNLDGPWTIWHGSDEQELSIDFLQQGYDLIGNAATNDGHSILFKGTVGQDGKSVTGIWENTTGTSGNFSMELNDALSSFSGNLGGGVAFCGTRMGSSKPYPCLN